MATQQLQNPVQAFLAAYDIAPDAAGDYDVRELASAIRTRGWDVSLDGRDGDWVAQIGEQLAPLEFRYAVAGDPDPAEAVLTALDIALNWDTAEAAE